MSSTSLMSFFTRLGAFVAMGLSFVWSVTVGISGRSAV